MNEALALSIVGDIEHIIDRDPRIRDLTLDDLKKLKKTRGEQKPIPTTQRLRDRHHQLARCLADGMPDYEASAITGYCASRISILKGDPAFQDLVHFYKARKDAQYVDMHKRLASLSADAAALLHERMEETPEDITTGQLMEVVKLGADRTGFGPQQSTTVNVNVNMSERLRLARERAINHEARKLIDVTPENVDEA